MMLSNGGAAADALKQDACRVIVLDDAHKQEFMDSFADAPRQPREAGVVSGLNTGHGSQTKLTLYVLP